MLNAASKAQNKQAVDKHNEMWTQATHQAYQTCGPCISQADIIFVFCCLDRFELEVEAGV